VLLNNFNKALHEAMEDNTSFKQPERITNLSKERLLQLLCEDMTRVHKHYHPYSRKKFKPNTVTLIDFINYGFHKRVNVLHPYIISITGYGIDNLVLKNRISVEVLDNLCYTMGIINKYTV